MLTSKRILRQIQRYTLIYYLFKYTGCPKSLDTAEYLVNNVILKKSFRQELSSFKRCIQ